MTRRVQTLGLDFVNAYLIEAEGGFVLVDCGLPLHWHRLKAMLDEAGCGPGNLRLVVLTHGDPDHAGNCTKLRELYGAPIAAHPAELPALQSGILPARSVRTVGIRVLYALLNFVRRLRRGSTPMPGFSPDILLEDGQSLAAYGLEARVIHLPGHTPGSLGLLTAEGALFAGDSVTNRRYPAPSPFVENIVTYRGSLEKLRSLAPKASFVYPGHGSPFPAAGLARLEL